MPLAKFHLILFAFFAYIAKKTTRISLLSFSLVFEFVEKRTIFALIRQNILDKADQKRWNFSIWHKILPIYFSADRKDDWQKNILLDTSCLFFSDRKFVRGKNIACFYLIGDDDNNGADNDDGCRTNVLFKKPGACPAVWDSDSLSWQKEEEKGKKLSVKISPSNLTKSSQLLGFVSTAGALVVITV